MATIVHKQVQHQYPETPYPLTQADPNIEARDGRAGEWADIWRLQVPVGQVLVCRPGHTFAAHLRDTTHVEVGAATCAVKIEKRDPSESDVLLLYGPDLYISSVEFQDEELKARLRVPVEGIEISGREWLVISATDPKTISAANSYFELFIARRRPPITA